MTSGVLPHPTPPGFTGTVITPDDAGYEAARNTVSHVGSPAAVLVPRTTGDVAVAVGLARDSGVALSVRSGGHSGAGYSTNDGGVVIDLSAMNTVRVIDRDAGVVEVGAGARWGAVATALAEYGLAISSGDTRSVGVGGLVLGGGIGWMARTHGLTIDTLRAATVITADGRELRASSEENPDLFWAVRGGGGSVGVVTSFELVATPTRFIHTTELHFDGTMPAELIQGWAEATATAPRELTAVAFRPPPEFGPLGGRFIVAAAYSEDDESAAAAAFAPLTGLGEAISAEIKRVPYHEVLEDPPPASTGPAPRVRNRFIRSWADGVAATIAEHATAGESTMLQLRSVGGAVNDVASDATAFAHRDATSLVVTAEFGSDGAATADGLWEALAPHTSGAYTAFMSDPTGEDLHAAFPARTYDRLAAIKREYDPENLFARTPGPLPR